MNYMTEYRSKGINIQIDKINDTSLEELRNIYRELIIEEGSKALLLDTHSLIRGLTKLKNEIPHAHEHDYDIKQGYMTCIYDVALALKRHLEEYNVFDKFTDKILLAMVEYLNSIKGWVNQNQIAKGLGINKAQLSRKLNENKDFVREVMLEESFNQKKLYRLSANGLENYSMYIQKKKILTNIVMMEKITDYILVLQDCHNQNMQNPYLLQKLKQKTEINREMVYLKGFRILQSKENNNSFINDMKLVMETRNG